MIKYLTLTMMGAAFVLMITWTYEAKSQEVKYCKNRQTGEVIVVEIGYPCPFPTSKI